jgi:ubiquinone/menaquinone biosynthesis C-methylase UbiE
MTAGSVFDQDASRKLEATYQTPDVIAQRAATLRALALQAGERVVDVGSGPGLLAAEMAAQVGPAGRVIGLDLSDPMLALSRQRCSDPAISRCLSFLKADAARLPFADRMFDVAVSTQVYEYVPDVPAALAEVYRVLRPGGRVLILDTDWDSLVWAAGDQARMQRLLEAWVERFADPQLPRSLSSQLESVGFQVERREVLVLFNPEYDPDTYSVANGQIMADFAVAQGRMSREEAEAWMRDLQRLGSQGRYFFSLNRYLFLATKRS